MVLPSSIRYSLGLFSTMTSDPNAQIPIKRYRIGQMASYEILVSDFDRIEAEAMTIGTDFAFAIALLPVAVTLMLALVVSKIDIAWVRDTFLTLMLVCYILGLYFSVRAYRQRGHLKRVMQAVRDAQVAPLGEKGSEIGPSELEALPAEQESSGPEKKK
jgi:hypothetical protein